MTRVVRWKVAGVAVGVCAVVGSTTAAYACLSGPATTAGERATVSTAQPATDAAAVAHAATVVEQTVLDRIADVTSMLEAKVSALGTPATLTPRQAWKIKKALELATFLRDRLAASAQSPPLTAAQVTTANALDARLASVQARLRSVLANATIAAAVKPAAVALATHKTDVLADRTRHHCDGSWDGWRRSGTRYSAYRDGDRRWGDGSWGDGSWDGHHR